ncbi:MAG: PAS domain-containing protein [Opitutaceae bacterium]
MAPGTAVVFMLHGMALAIRGGRRSENGARWLVRLALSVGVIVVVLDAGRSWGGAAMFWDRWFPGSGAVLQGVLVGVMSPLTALNFLLGTVALGLMAPYRSDHRRQVVMVAPLAMLIISILVLGDYFTGAVGLYGSLPVPMAFLTAVGFWVLSFGLVALHRGFPEFHRNDGGVNDRDAPPSYFFVSAGLIVAIGLVGFLYIRNKQRVARPEAVANLDAVANLRAEQIEQWWHERLGDVNVIAGSELIRAGLQRYLAGPTAETEQPVRDLMENLCQAYGYESVALHDDQHRLVLSAPSDAADHDIRLEALAQAWSVEAGVAESAVFMVSDSDHVHHVVNVAIPSIASDGLAGHLSLVTNMREELFPLLDTWPVPSSTAECLLLNDDAGGWVILNTLRHAGAAAITQAKLFQFLQLPWSKSADRRGTGVLEGIDYRGELVLATARRIPGTSLLLVVKIDQREVFAAVRSEALHNFTLLALFLLALTLTAIYYWRQRKLILVSQALAWEVERNTLAQRLERVADRTPGFVYEYRQRPDGTACFPYASEGIKWVYGVSPQEVRDDAGPVFQILHPDDLARIRESIAVSSANLTVWRCEYRVARPGEEIRWVEGNAMPVRDSDGSTLWHGFIQDITERRKIEDTVKEQRNRLHEIIEGTNAGTWEWDVPSGSITVNERWAEMLGWTRTELGPTTIQTWSELVHPDDRSKTQAELERYFRGEVERYECEHRVRHKDGHWVWVRDVGKVFRWSPEHQPLVMRGTHVDITVLKETEAALRRSEHNLSDILNAMPVAVFWKDRDSVYLGCNSIFARDAGLANTREVLGRTDHAMNWKDNAALFIADDQQVITTGQPKLAIAEELPMPDGRTVSILTNKIPLRDSRGEIIGVLGAYTDIGSLKDAERRLKLSLAEKEALLKEVHHRVKNNLQIITSLLRLESGRATPSVRPVLVEMQGRVRSMGLLHETIYRAGVFGRVNLAVYLEGLCVQLNRAQGGGLDRVQLATRFEPVEVGIDQAIPCGLILNELVTNAYKHAFPAGRLPTAPAMQVTLTRAAAETVCLRVADNGIGLPPDFALEQLSSLGLNLVRDLAVQLHGELAVDGSAGTTIKVTFAPKHTD